LARQVWVFTEDPVANLMTTFDFTNAMLDEGTMFTFGSWVCVGDGVGDFRWHLVDDKKPEASATTFHHELDDFVDNLDEMLLPD
jgi:hypothetical protein